MSFCIDLSDDPTHDLNVEFANNYKSFTKRVLVDDERIANILCRYLRPCATHMKTTNIDTIYRVSFALLLMK